MDAPRLAHLTELPPPLRWPLACWFSEDRMAIWVLANGLAVCLGCQSMKAVFQISRWAGKVEMRCIGCAKEPDERPLALLRHRGT